MHRFVRAPLALLCLFVLVSAPIERVFAQAFNPQTHDSRKIAITPTGQTSFSIGSIGDVHTIELRRVNREVRDTRTEVHWVAEPASAVRFTTNTPTNSVSAPFSLEFLSQGTVTVTAYAYDSLQAADEISAEGSNNVTFTFSVAEPGSTGEGPEPPEAESEQAEAETETETEPTEPENEIANEVLLNPNQRATNTALNSVCDELSLSDEAQLSAARTRFRDTCETLNLLADPRQSLDNISAEEFFAIGDSLSITSDYQISNIQSRLTAVRQGQRRGFDVSALQLRLWDQHIPGSVLSSGADNLLLSTSAGAGAAAIEDDALGFFVSGTVSLGEIDGKGIQRGGEVNSNGLTVGADYRLTEQRVVGAALGIVNDNTDFTGDNGQLSMNGFSFSVFGTWHAADKGYADFILELGQNDFELSRRINIPTADEEFALGTTNASRVAFSLNAGRTVRWGRTEFGPSVRINFTRASIDGFRESSSLGNLGAATELDVDAHSLTSIRFSVGGEVKRPISTTKAVFVPTARLDFEVENNSDKGVITARFVNDSSNHQLRFRGVERDTTALVLSVGTTAVFRNSQSAFVFIETRALDDVVSQSRLKLGYRAHF